MKKTMTMQTSDVDDDDDDDDEEEEEEEEEEEKEEEEEEEDNDDDKLDSMVMSHPKNTGWCNRFLCSFSSDGDDVDIPSVGDADAVDKVLVMRMLQTKCW